jgi:hypothetical protein
MQNQYNARIRKDNRSGVKGVYWYPKYGKWTAKIRAGGKAKTLGYFPCKAAAAVAYARASVELHREFGRLA